MLIPILRKSWRMGIFMLCSFTLFLNARKPSSAEDPEQLLAGQGGEQL